MSDDDAIESRGESGARDPGRMPPGGDPTRRARFPWEGPQCQGGPLLRVEELRRHPEVSGEDWVLALIPAMVEPIESAEWYGSAELLTRFLEAELGPLPPCLARPADLLDALRRAVPRLRAWGYVVRIDPHPAGGEAVHVDGTSGCSSE